MAKICWNCAELKSSQSVGNTSQKIAIHAIHDAQSFYLKSERVLMPGKSAIVKEKKEKTRKKHKLRINCMEKDKVSCQCSHAPHCVHSLRCHD